MDTQDDSSVDQTTTTHSNKPCQMNLKTILPTQQTWQFYDSGVIQKIDEKTVLSLLNHSIKSMTLSLDNFLKMLSNGRANAFDLTLIIKSPSPEKPYEYHLKVRTEILGYQQT